MSGTLNQNAVPYDQIILRILLIPRRIIERGKIHQLNRAGNCNIRQTGAPIKGQLSDLARSLRNGERGKHHTAGKRIISDGFELFAILDVDDLQFLTLRKRPAADSGKLRRQRHLFQGHTVPHRIIVDIPNMLQGKTFQCLAAVKRIGLQPFYRRGKRYLLQRRAGIKSERADALNPLGNRNLFQGSTVLKRTRPDRFYIWPDYDFLQGFIAGECALSNHRDRVRHGIDTVFIRLPYTRIQNAVFNIVLFHMALGRFDRRRIITGYQACDGKTGCKTQRNDFFHFNHSSKRAYHYIHLYLSSFLVII